MSKPRKSDRKLPTQPVLWAEGRQQPPFDLRAFGRVSLLIARQGIGPLLGKVAERLGVAGSAVATGRARIPEHRLGHSGQWLPSHQNVGAGIAGLGAICAQAGEMVLPPPAPVEPLAFPDLLSLAPKHRRAAERLADLPAPTPPPPTPATEAPASKERASEPPAAEPAASEPQPRKPRRERPKATLRDITPVDPPLSAADADLLAIRAMLADVQSAPALPEPPRPVVAQARSAPPLPQPAATAPIYPDWEEIQPEQPAVSLTVPKRGKSFVMAFVRLCGRTSKRVGLWAMRHQRTRAAGLTLRAALARTTARALGWALTAIALPYGAFKATMIHLNGEDLRRWE